MFGDSSDPSSSPPKSDPKPKPQPIDLSPPQSDPKPTQELTLSYLCDNSKAPPVAPAPAPAPAVGDSLIDKLRSKGKEVADDNIDDHRWVERDFLHLSGGAVPAKPQPPPAKRELPDGSSEVPDGREKKVKVETLSLSLGPPNLSLSLNSSLPLPNSIPPAAAPLNPVHPVPVKRSYSNNTRTTNSDDFAPSLSYSQSVPFSHNPSCSLTRNSTENYDFSRENEQMWYAGEGTNGSVHSRFKPVGDGNGIVAFANQNKELNSMNGNGNNINNNGVYRVSSSENLSFFPSDLPARPGKANVGVASSESGRNNGMLTRPDRVLKEIVSESVPVVAQTLQEFSGDALEGLKECLRNLMNAAERKEEFASFQRRLERRSDLTFETLSKAHKVQLEILVAIRTGVVGFLSAKNRIPSAELVEIFLFMRCRNPGCKSLLPVDDCDCKICTTKKGFCSACMCPICLNFDCANNTCSWVGCDVCSHWCHALCGIQRNLIKPGASPKGGGGMTEMQFHCMGCGHASEMFGFVKEVFNCCAKDWGLETLMKELDCVRMIFRGSEDFEGKELERKAEEMFTMLSKKHISPLDACNGMLQFFKYGVSDLSVTGSSSKNILATQANTLPEVTPLPPMATITPPKPTYNLKPITASVLESQIDAALKSEPIPKQKPSLATESHFGVQLKEDGFQSLETIVRFKEAEAKLFQRLADDARKEVEGYRQIARAKSEKLEEEYATKLAKLCLQETEERRRKKLEELKFLENSHCDYHNMKMRMQAEIASLLERMEATKKQWV